MSTTAKRRPGRPATGKGSPINVRLHAGLLVALDREAKRLTKERGGPVSRSEAVRDVLARTLLKGAR